MHLSHTANLHTVARKTTQCTDTNSFVAISSVQTEQFQPCQWLELVSVHWGRLGTVIHTDSHILWAQYQPQRWCRCCDIKIPPKVAEKIQKLKWHHTSKKAFFCLILCVSDVSTFAATGASVKRYFQSIFRRRKEGVHGDFKHSRPQLSSPLHQPSQRWCCV